MVQYGARTSCSVVDARDRGPITCIDQTAGRFKTTMFEKFKKLVQSGVSDKTYGERTPYSVKENSTK